MRRRRTPLVASCLLAGLFACTLTVPAFAQNKAAAPSAAKPAETADRVDLQKRFDAALKLYSQGQYEKAIAELDEIIKLDPTSHEAMTLREKAGMGTLVNWLKDPKTSTVARLILRKAAEESALVSRDKATIDKLIQDLGSDEVAVRWPAIRQLAAVGAVAVPPVLDVALSSESPVTGSRKVGALIVLRNMGPAATLPLVTALLHADDTSAARIAELLGENPDARALPALLCVAENPKDPTFLRDAAAKAADRILPPAPLSPAAKDNKESRKGEKGELKAAPAPRAVDAAQACYALAQRYYYGDPSLVELTPLADRVQWSWNPAGKTYAERLVAKPTAVDSFSRVMAQDLIRLGLIQKHADPNLVELYVSNSFMLLEESPKDLAMQFEDAATANAVIESLGTEYLYLSLGRALRDSNTALARRAIDAIRNIGDPRAPRENTLIAAMSYPDKVVRIAAAETLTHISPSGQLGGADDVVRVMAAGLGARVREVVVILSADELTTKRVAGVVKDAGMTAHPFDNVVDAMRRVKDAVPPANLLVIDTNQKKSDVAAVVESVRKDARSSALPILLLAPAENVEALRAAGLKVADVLPLNAEPAILKTAMEKAVAASQTSAADDVRENTELVHRILIALSLLPAGTHYPVQGLGPVAAALLDLKGQANETRILALKVIGNLPGPGLRDRVYTVFVNPEQPAEVRRAAGEALLALLPTDPGLVREQRGRLRAMTNEKAEADAALRAQAVHALALVAVPQVEREALIDRVGPKAVALEEKSDPAAATRSTSVTPTTTKSPTTTVASPTTTLKPAAPKATTTPAKPAPKTK